MFTFGTRLTRVTRPLRIKRREQALRAAAHLVSDWDGGTRIGDALQAFLAVPRFAGYARGAAVLVVSDGLERGDVAAMRDAVAKLSRRAWRLSWLTPLATGRAFTPQTAALVAIRPIRRRNGRRRVERGDRRAYPFAQRTEGRVTEIVDAHHHIWRQDGPALARRPHAAAHLRALRADPTRLSDPRISRRHRRLGVTQSVYVQTNWAKDRVRATRRPGCRRTHEETGWPHALVAYADLAVEGRAPAA